MTVHTLPRRAGSVEPAANNAGSDLDGDAAQALLADLGFLLVPGPPLDSGAAYLMIALRPHPTKAHFDAERIEYWTLDDDRAEPTELVWPMNLAGPRYSWGPVRIVDRVRATNTFVSFGGVVAVSRDLDVHAALFRSDAPILSLGGHSGPADPLAANVSGFLAVLRAAAGDSTVRQLADSLSPLSLYAAFLWRTLDMYRRASPMDTISPHLMSVLRAEQGRLQSSSATDEAAGRELAEQFRTL